MIEMKVTVGPDAYQSGDFVYVWINGNGMPIYVGETGKCPSDRVGLHIRARDRSGAIMSKIIHARSSPSQEYVVLSFQIDTQLLEAISKENGAGIGAASNNRARKALERKVFDVLDKEYQSIHPARGCRWSAQSGQAFADNVLHVCRGRGPQ